MQLRRHTKPFPHRVLPPHRARFIGWGLAVTCLASSFVWFIFVSGYWNVRTLDIQGLQDLNRGEVSAATFDILDHGSWKPWSRRNIFFLQPEQLSRDLKELLFADEVLVDKKYPNVLRLIMKERKRSVILFSKNQFLHVDITGVITGEVEGQSLSRARSQLAGAARADAAHMPLIACELAELTAPGYQATTAQGVRRWIEAHKELVMLGLRFRYLALDQPASNTLKIVSDQGYVILIDLNLSLAPQIESYKKFLRTQPKNFIAKEYVDLRIPGKIFVK